MTFLVADGVVPSNEDRGYVLRRVMRRAILQGRALELEPGFLRRYGERVREVMGAAYPELGEQADAIDTWLGAEEEAFGRTLETGLANLNAQIARAREEGSERIDAEDAFQLHDTFGFPVRPHEGAAGRGGPRRRRGGLRAADGRAARARPRLRRRRRAGRAEPARARPRVRRGDRREEQLHGL